MIDFTNLSVRNKTYAGANGSKISVLYNNGLYMLKFPAAPSINKNMSYANGCISEYLGSHIFAIVGIPVQETLLESGLSRGDYPNYIFFECVNYPLSICSDGRQ